MRTGKHRVPACNRAYDWLHDIKISHELQEYRKVRALLPESTWENYDLFGVGGLREQLLLREAVNKLRARWRKKRPAMFNSDHKKERGQNV